MLKGFSKKESGRIWIGFIGLRIAPQADTSEQSREYLTEQHSTAPFFTQPQKSETKKYTVSRKLISYNKGFLPRTVYRVSIKSFPDYKHLLQENYAEYKLVEVLKPTNVL